MNYFLQITDSKGEKSLVPIGKVMNVEVNPGDDIVVMDESGNPVDVSLRPENEDLAILFENGSKAILEDFYAQEEGAEPITISLNPIEPESEAYEFNSQTGNLPNAKSFTLMRFSNTEYIEFVEQLDELSRDVLPIGNQAPASTGGGGGNEQEVAEQTIIQTTNGNGPLPSAVSDSGNGIDGGPAIAINLIANDNDPVGGGLTLQAIAGVGVSPGDRVTLPSGTVVVVGASGNVSVEPGSKFQSLRVGQSETESFQYSIVDTNGNVATSQVVINVSGVNDPPTAVADEFKVGEDAPVTVDVLANDSDPDVGDTLTVTGISTPASGVATLNGDNSITFDPNGGFENLAVGETATVVVAYTLSDDAGATSNSTVTFVVEGRNDAPEADNDFSSTDQNSQLMVNTLLNDTDPDGSDTLTITGVTQPSSGLVLHNEGNVTFDPNGDFDALGVGQTELVTFQYDISDGNGGTDTATVTVTVTGVDDATETNPDFGSTNEETAVTIDVLSNDSDIDANDALSIDSVGQPANANDGVVVNNGNNLTFTPGSNFDSLAFGESATTTFEYTAIAAGSGETAIETVTVTIHGINDNPEARNDATRTDQDAPITIDVLTNDTDVDTSDFLIVTGVDQPSKGSATVNSENRIVFDPGNDFDSLDDGVEETVTFDYFISDGNGGTDVATVTVTVTGVEDPTNTAPDEGETDEATAIVLNVLDNDTDPDAGEVLAINSVSTPAKGSTSTNGTTITFNPNGDFEDLAVGETELVTFQYTLTTGEVETVTVTVNGLNDGPVAVNDAETTNEDSVVNIDLLGADDSVAADSDVDGDTLMVTEINGVTAGGTITLASGALVTVNANGTVDYDPNGKFENLDGGDQVTDSFTYTISDGNGGTATATATVTINGADDAMVTNPDSASTLEGTPVTIDVLNNDSDPDADDNPLEIASMSQPTNTDDGVATIVGTNVTFTPGTNFESLAVGESAVTTFEYTARAPGSNETQTESVTVTVIGQNDGPLAVNDTGSVDEDATLNVAAGGGVLINDSDVDLSDGLTVTEVRTGTETGTGTGALIGNTLVGTYGTLTLDADGSYTYTADQDVTDALPVGDTVNDIFTYTVSDGNGGTDTAELNITVTGVNDAPPSNPSDSSVGVFDDVDEIDEDAAPITGDVLANDSDPDTGDTLTVSEVNGVAGNVANAVTGTFGDLTLAADGTYSYDLDSTDSIIQALGVGETQIDSFTYTADDGNGGSAAATLTVTINGVNDAPPENPPGTPGVDFGVFDDADSISEDTFPNTTAGNVLDNDLDPDGDTLTVSEVDGASGDVGAQVTGAYGVVTIASDGSYSYTLDNSNATVQALGVGENILETFDYTASDGNGGTATATLTITINGTNDGPVAVDDSGTGVEDNDITGNVITNDTDIDGDSPLTVVSNTDPSNGSVVVNSDGSYTYTPNLNFNGTDSFTYVMQDPSGATDTATVTLTVTPANDPPVAVDDAGAVNEDATFSVSAADGIVQTNDTDLDGDTLSVSGIRTGAESGSGTNGTLGTALTGTLGTLTVAADGSYTYVADQNAADSLAVGESSTDTFTYTISDGAGGNDTAELVITVIGQNDGPVAVNDSGAVDEDATLNVNATSGVLSNDSDLDLSDGLTVTQVRTGPESGSGTEEFVGNSLVGTYGTLTLNADGSYSYSADQDVTDALPVGDTVNDIFTYTVSDGNGGTDTAELNITITGVNDAPPSNPTDSSIGVFDDVDDINEDAADPITGDVRANDSDPDGDTLTVSEVNGVAGNVANAVTGTFGDLTLAADGTYSYELDSTIPTIQALGVGETQIDSFTYTADDGNGGSATATLTITINGVNDVPPENPPTGTPGVDFGVYDDSNSIAEDEFPNTKNGNVLDNDLDPDGDTLTVSEVAGAGSGVGASVSGTYGVVTIDSNGDYTYTLDNSIPAIQALAVGETVTDSFDYTANDGNGGTATATLTITINGTNDAPPSNPTDSSVGVFDDVDDINEDAPDPITGDVLANDSDPDTNDTLTVGEVNGVAGNVGNAVTGTFGDLTLNADGSYSYDLDSTIPTIQALGVGETQIETFSYTANDGNGGSAAATLTITINGVNDVPPENPPGTPGVTFGVYDDTDSISEDDFPNNTSGNVLSNDLDPDGDTLTVSEVDGDSGDVGTQVTGTYGVVTIENDGTYNYQLDNSNATVQALGSGESILETFDYTASDGNGGTATATLTITINGTNDGPVAVDDSGTGVEDNDITGNVITNDTDIDGDSPLTVVSNTDPSNGSVSVNADGSYTYTPNLNFNGTDSFTYVMQDPSGATDTATVTLTVTPANDPPVAANDTGTVDEDDTLTVNAVNGIVQTNDTDIDGDSLTVSTIRTGEESGAGTSGTVGVALTGTLGTLTVASDGSYSYVADQTAADNLAVGESSTDTFTYTISDGNGASDTAELEITVIGQNDGPVAVNDSGAVDEDATTNVDAASGVLNNDTDLDLSDGLTVTEVRTGTETGTGTGALIGNTLVGTYGTLTLDADGSYTYTADQDVTDALPVGDTINDIFTYTVSDGNGGTDTAELNITVTGVNDAPPSNPTDSSVGVFDDVDEIDEDAAPITGDVLANDSDPDTGDTLTVSEVNGVAGNVANAVTGTFGDLTLAADGTYSYDLDSTDSIIQALGVGETQIDSFTYTADDGNGGSAAATLTITINGVNDAPPENPPGTPGVDFGVFDDADSISEDAFPNSTNGNVLDNDLDPDGDTLTVSEVEGASGDVGSQVSGTYGVITIDSDGEYIYQLDNSNATVQALGDGETVLETFDYTANDGNGGTATATLTITINGVNDATVTAPDRGITDEDTAITIDVLANDDDADQNDSLTITSVTQPSDSNDGVVTNNGGDLTFTPGSNFDSLGANESATTTFTYTTIAAGSNETATETVTVTVNGLNDAPTAVDDAETTDQDTVVNIDLLGADDSVAADSDPDNDALTVTQINGITAGGVITLASGALLQVNGNGTVDYDPNGQFDSLDQGDSATDSFTYVISDGNGGTSTATATVTINGVEDATDTEPDIGVTDEETPITLSVLDNDTDPDAGETLTIASVSTPSKGSVSTDGTTVTFNPNSEFEDLGVGESEVITFEYTLTTGEVETVTVTVNGVNDGPVAVNDIESTNQDSVVNIDLLGADDSLAADSDPDGDALTVTEINGVTSGGTITLASGALVTVNGNGTVDYNPNDQFDSLAAGSSVTDSFTYVISDGNGATSTATATVTINGVDDAMETDPDFGSTFEGSPVTIDVLNNDSDLDTGDTLSINSVNQPADANDGTVVNNGTDLTFTPGSNFESLGVGESATTTFTYVAESAGSGETRTETVTVTINGLNDDPTAADDIGNTDEDTSIAIDVLTNDTDLDTNDTLTVTAVSQPPGGQGSTSVTSSGGDVTFNPGNDFQDLAQGETEIVVFDYDVSDGSGGNDNATVRVTVTGVNDNPDLVDDFETTDEETAVVIDVLANDSDVDNGDTLTLTDVTSPGPGNGTASITNGGTRITFDPGSDFQDLAVGESEEVTFQYEVTDSYGATSTADVTVTVEGLNDGPDADDDEDDTTENTSIVIDVLDNDDDPDTSDTLTITNVSSTSSGRGTPSISGGGTTVTFDPGTDFDYLSGSESEIVSFTYDISDGNGGTDTATVLVTVNGVNDNPEANDDDGETDEDSAVVISVLNNDTDSDTGDTLTVISVDTPALGNTAITGGGTTVTFNPGTDYNYLGEGEEEIVSVDYTIADDSGATDTATILITVNGTNDRPGAVNDQTSTDENNSVVIDVTNNDQDPDSTDTLTVTSVTTPSPNQGTVSITNGGADVTFDPGSDFDDLAVGDFRVVTFNYVVADDEGASDSAMVEVTVNGTNDGPVADPDFATTTQNSNRVIQVLTNDDDPDTGDNLTVININQPDPGKGTASIRNSGTRVRFEPGDDFDSLADGESEEVTFSYVISDGNGGTDTADITVTVTGTNDGPTATDDFDTTNEDTSKVIDVLGNDDDPDTTDTLTVTGVTGPPAGKGSVSITNGGADVTFDPGSDFDSLAQGAFEEVTFSYTMEDGDGETDTANVTITVTGVNDAPVANDDTVVSTTDIDPVTIDVISNDTDIDGTVDPTTIDLDQSQSGQQTTLSITGEGLWEVLPGGNVRFTPESGIDSQPSSITYSVEDNNGAISLATINLKYSAADVWFGNDESGSVNNSDFDQSQALISGAANQMTFATGDLAFNAALFSWSGNNEQENKIALSSDEAQFATAAANYDREYRGWTEIGEAIRFGTTQIVNSVAAKRLAGDPRAEVPQVMVILTDADPDTQIIGDSDLLPAATAAKDAGIILVFVAIQEAAEPDGVARLQQAASEDGNNQPLVVVADSYADIDAGEIADLLNAIREAAAAGLLPVVIDMDGDGVEFNDIESGIEFDADDDGQVEKVAWADEDDAVLVYDENGNDTIDGLSEIAFARYSDEIGATDLEGLRHFDSNEDLILDANDDEFDSFKLWQDRDGDGEVGEGEMMTLTEAGIESLELVSDENSYYTAGGDVHVHGEAGVNYADGSKGTLADATFGYEELRDGDDSLEIITDSGETLDVNDSSSGGIEPVAPDLLEDKGQQNATEEGQNTSEGGAAMPTSIDDDVAAADSAMS